jgi:hypothetical protein
VRAAPRQAARDERGAVKLGATCISTPFYPSRRASWRGAVQISIDPGVDDRRCRHAAEPRPFMKQHAAPGSRASGPIRQGIGAADFRPLFSIAHPRARPARSCLPICAPDH